MAVRVERSSQLALMRYLPVAVAGVAKRQRDFRGRPRVTNGCGSVVGRLSPHATRQLEDQPLALLTEWFIAWRHTRVLVMTDTYRGNLTALDRAYLGDGSDRTSPASSIPPGALTSVGRLAVRQHAHHRILITLRCPTTSGVHRPQLARSLFDVGGR